MDIVVATMWAGLNNQLVVSGYSQCLTIRHTAGRPCFRARWPVLCTDDSRDSGPPSHSGRRHWTAGRSYSDSRADSRHRSAARSHLQCRSSEGHGMTEVWEDSRSSAVHASSGRSSLPRLPTQTTPAESYPLLLTKLAYTTQLQK